MKTKLRFRALFLLMLAGCLWTIPSVAQEMTESQKKRAVQAQALIDLAEPLLAECRRLRSAGVTEIDGVPLRDLCTMLEKDLVALRTWLPGGTGDGSLSSIEDIPPLQPPNPRAGNRQNRRTGEGEEEAIDAFRQKFLEYLDERKKW